MLSLPGLSPVAGKDVVVKFDGGRLSSDGGILTLREIEGRLRVAERSARALVTHTHGEGVGQQRLQG
jgi:hypothetical protein